MEYADLKSKINALHVSLTEQLTIKYDQLVDLQKEIIDKVINHEMRAKDGLAQLETALLQTEEEKDQHISSLKSLITQLKAKLENSLNSFKENNQAKLDKEQIALQKEGNLSSLTAPKKKEIDTLKQKINTLDRECLLNLKAKALEYEEEEKNYKAKINDLDKRLRYEIQKISDAILIPMKVGNANTESQAITDPKEIKEYRIKGINEIAQLKVKYYNDLEQLDLNFYRYHYDYHRDNDIIREQYNQKIEDLNYAIKKIEVELEAMTEENTIEVFKQLSLNERDYKLAYNNIRRSYQKRQLLYQDNIIKTNYEKSDIRDQNVNDVLSKIYDNDVYQLQNIEFNDNYLVLIFQELKKTLAQLLDSYLNLVTGLVNGFGETYHHLIEEFSTHFIMDNYHSILLDELTYQEHQELVKQTITSYITLSKQKFQQFLNLVNKKFNEMNQKINELYKLARAFQKDNTDDLLALRQNLAKLFGQALDAGKDKQKREERLKRIGDQYITYQSENIKLIHTLIDEDKETRKQFKEVSDTLKANLEKVNQKQADDLKKIADEYEQNIANSKENINKIKIKYKNKMKHKEKQIKQKYENEITKVEIERKNKIKISLS
jgi:hypothetical protein